MIQEELENKDRISRRKALKRIGAGVAVAWSAPILTSIRTPAFAQYGNRCPDTGCPEENFEPCTGNPPGCQTGSCTEDLGCFQYQDVEGRCHCFQNVFCSCVEHWGRCESSRDCPLGMYCIPQSGCGAVTICIHCCGESCRDDEDRSRPKGATAKG